MKKLLVLFAIVCVATITRATTYTVNTSGMTFSPSSVSIKMGDTVKWVCSTADGIAHTSTSGGNCTADGIWNSGNMNPGASFSRVFTASGTYNYFCTYHCSMGMVGKVIVSSSTGISTETFAKIQCSLAPNPTAGQTYLKICLSQPTTVAVSLYTLTGKVISMSNLPGAIGNNLFPIDIQSFPAGLYFVRVSGEGILPENTLLEKE